MKRTAAVAELKAHLSGFLTRVKSGEEILVTERGRPVARLIPVAGGPELDQNLRELERQGLLRVGSGKLPRDFWKLPRARDARASIRKAVADEREQGW